MNHELKRRVQVILSLGLLRNSPEELKSRLNAKKVSPQCNASQHLRGSKRLSIHTGFLSRGSLCCYWEGTRAGTLQRDRFAMIRH